MADPIRLLHFADLHVGMENYGRLDPETGTSSRVRDFLNRLDEVIDYALARDVDLAVFAGDAFKTRDPDPTQQREFARRIKRLADAAPTLLLVGNHDLPGMAKKATSVDIFRALDVPNVIVGHDAECRVVETKRGPVCLAWMPYPMRNRLLAQDEHRGKSVEELDLALRDTVTSIIKGLAAEADRLAMPRVFAGHFSVSEAKFGSERSVMLGRDVAILKSELANPVWDYVALGHIHKYQNLSEREGAEGQGSRDVACNVSTPTPPRLHTPPIVYSGSLERIDFGEEREPKGFCWVELERGNTRYQFVEVRARRFITIHADVRSASDPTAAVLARIAEETLHATSVLGQETAEAVVRVIVKLKSEQEASLREREIEKALSAAYSVAIAKEAEHAARMRLGGAAPESMTPMELVAQYFKNKDYESARIDKLVEYAEKVISDQSSDGSL